MNEQAFRAQVARHELTYRDTPRAFSRWTAVWAASGHAAIGLMVLLVTAVVACLGVSVITGGPQLWHLLLLAMLATLAWPLTAALGLRQPAPEGRTLARHEAPALFDLVDRLCERCQAPPPHTLMLHDRFELSLVQQAKLGVLGWHHDHLTLGLPLLMALDTQQVAALIAHEFGHLRGGHGRLNTWIYRTRRSWSRLQQVHGQSGWRGSPGDVLLHLFFTHFYPHFNARALVLAREQEAQADRLARRIAGSAAVASALTSLAIHRQYLQQAFWPALWNRATGPDTILPKPLLDMRVLLKEALPHPQVGLWLRDAVKTVPDVLHAQPGLRERIEATGQIPVVPSPPVRTAADKLLGPGMPAFIEALDLDWQARHLKSWQEAGESRRRQERLVLELAQADPVQRLNLDELMLWARAAWTLQGPAGARAPLRAALDRHRSPPEARYLLANALLATVEPLQPRSQAPEDPPELQEALALLRSVVDDSAAPPSYDASAHTAPEWALPAARRLDTVLAQREAFEHLKPLRERLHQLEHLTAEAYQQLEDFDGPQALGAATVSPRVLREPLRLLAQEEAVGQAWLLRKTTPAARGWALHLLVVERSQALFQPDHQTWWQSLHERLALPFNVMVLDLAHPFWADPQRTDLVNQFRQTAGACIYRR